MSRRSIARSWTVVDQAASSVTNFVFVVAVARSVDAKTFGAFSLAYLAYALLLGAGRAVGGELLLLRAGEARHDVERDSRRLLALALCVGLLAAPILLAVAAAVRGPLVGCLLVLALALPVLLAQDALRYCYFARRSPAGAAGNDALWLAIELAALAGVWAADPSPGAPALIAAWTAGAGVALGLGMWRARLYPVLNGVSRWITEDRSRVASFFGDFALSTGSVYFSLYLVALVGSAQDVGAVRAGLLLYAPVDTLVAGVRILALPALARSRAVGGDEMRARARVFTLIYLGAAGGWAALVLAAPDRVGEAVLGKTWPLAEPLLLSLGVACAARYAVLPALDGIRAYGGGRQLVVVRALTGALTFSAVVVGTVLAGAGGTANGLAAAYTAEAVLWWQSFRRRIRLRDRFGSGHL